mmetsp:Transcript_3935/g.7840  ORF Transcript_3935/g.7840 Transcript_3935/m.7840 type:complete len:152 (-) Transcript_3935:99-554(-)|eukprot:scaffold7020_cov214-Amphora_coffeaeformis.AAC.3
MKITCVTPKKCIHTKRSLSKLGRPKTKFMRLSGPLKTTSAVDDENDFILTVPEGRSATQQQYHKTLDNCFNVIPRVTQVPGILAALTDTSVDELDTPIRYPIIPQGSKFKLPMRPSMCNMTEEGSLYIPTVAKWQTPSSEDLENLSIPDFL